MAIGIVVDAQRHFLDDVVGRSDSQLHAGAQSQRTQRAVRRHGDVIGLGHGGDAADFGNAAGVGKVRLDDVDAGRLEERLEIPAAVEAFTQRDRRGRQLRQLRDAFDMLRQQRLFDEQRADRFEGVGQLLGHGFVHAAVEVEADIEAQRLDRSGALQHPVDDLG